MTKRRWRGKWRGIEFVTIRKEEMMSRGRNTVIMMEEENCVVGKVFESDVER